MYDLTNFTDHPGGYEVFKAYKGKNATESFTKACHPEYVREDMKKYLLGPVPTIHQSELKKHTAEDDMWFAIHGKVYDVTNFNTHPGGKEILLDNAGKDASKPFDDIEHSVSAKRDLEDYYVGEYIPGLEHEQSRKFNYLVLIPLLIIILGIALSNLWN